MTDRETLHRMFNARQVADYKELVEVSSDEADDSIKAAREFIEEIKGVVSKEPSEFSEPNESR